MRQLQVFDAPIRNPDDDLFGVSDYAERLSEFIRAVTPPFTIGVYGEWGDGKTSFVELLKHYLHASPPEQFKGSSLLCADDLTDPGGLAAKLRQDAPDALSKYLRGRCPPATMGLLDKYAGHAAPPDTMQKALLVALNQALKEPGLYEAQRFAQLKLTKTTRELIGRDLQDEALVRFNRLLLEDAYPDEVARRHMKFITFSAWPHTTSDALWRALIIKIAKELYGVRETAGAEAEGEAPPPADGLWSQLSKFLLADALVLRRPRPEESDDYRQMVARLDRTAYGSISKSADRQLQVNQEVAMASLVNAALGALGTVSPLVAGVRSLFGMQSKLDLSELLQEKNEVTRDMIESVEEFRRAFRELFAKRARDRQIYVFIDDLDRCLPDVALDLLEAVKIFLDEVGCIFIVAADEHLIGQGLRLRFRDLMGGSGREQARTFFARKGQEYFEKIIQFAVRVPPRTPDQAHTFISAQFPKWTPAADIIQTAVGNNPRRLKQYCNLLSYQHVVSELQKGREAKRNRGGAR